MTPAEQQFDIEELRSHVKRATVLALVLLGILVVLGCLYLTTLKTNTPEPFEPIHATSAFDEADLAAHLKALDAKTNLTWPPTSQPSANPQQLIDAAPAGSALHIPGGVPKQRLSINKPLTIIFDGLFIRNDAGQIVSLQQDTFTVNDTVVTVSGPLHVSGSSGITLKLE